MAQSEAAIEALGGAIGSCIAFGFTFPLTSISTWAALEYSNTRTEVDTEDEDNKLLRLVPSPIKELIWHLRQPGGVRKLYTGLQPFLVGNVVSQGIYFYLYSALRQAIVAARAAASHKAGGVVSIEPSRSQDIGVLGSIVVASIAGSINATVTQPIWIITTQMQQAAQQQSRDPNTPQLTAWQRAEAIYHRDGPAGFWSGLVPSLIMVSNPTIQFILYEWLTARVLDLKRKRAVAAANGRSSPLVLLSAADAFLMSALAKLGATLATYPMQLIKNRMQASSRNPDERYRNVWDALVRIMRTEGVAGLFKGMKAKMLQTVLGAALLMSIKEHVYNTVKTLTSTGGRHGNAAGALIKAAR